VKIQPAHRGEYRTGADKRVPVRWTASDRDLRQPPCIRGSHRLPV